MTALAFKSDALATAQSATAPQRAFVFRMPDDFRAEGLTHNEIIIGWAQIPGMLDPAATYDQMRNAIKEIYHPNSKSMREAGAAAGHLWRFLRDMKGGDLVVVPADKTFYAARVNNEMPIYLADQVNADKAYRRSVTWLNSGKPISRKYARAALTSRLKAYGTCTDATDLIDDIVGCLEKANNQVEPSFVGSLRDRLTVATLEEIRTGYIDPRGFERLICDVMASFGAKVVPIPTIKDKGVDIMATFTLAGLATQHVAIQAKHYNAKPPVSAATVEQLINGIEAEIPRANMGMVITAGTIGEDAREKAETYTAATGLKIELIDGEQFAQLIVENGLRDLLSA